MEQQAKGRGLGGILNFKHAHSESGNSTKPAWLCCKFVHGGMWFDQRAFENEGVFS